MRKRQATLDESSVLILNWAAQVAISLKKHGALHSGESIVSFKTLISYTLSRNITLKVIFGFTYLSNWSLSGCNVAHTHTCMFWLASLERADKDPW
jgi:hypothetical protein